MRNDFGKLNLVLIGLAQQRVFVSGRMPAWAKMLSKFTKSLWILAMAAKTPAARDRVAFSKKM